VTEPPTAPPAHIILTLSPRRHIDPDDGAETKSGCSGGTNTFDAFTVMSSETPQLNSLVVELTKTCSLTSFAWSTGIAEEYCPLFGML
jgi:hypothetical protein